MATYMPSPGHFKGADADPEATLELFQDYLDKMEMIFRLSRSINPVTGQRVDWDNHEKKDMLVIEGGDEVQDLFKFVGKVLPGDTYAQAVEKIKTALRGRGNRTSAVFKLFHNHSQGSQSFDSWHKEIRKAAQLIDWTGYDADKATVDAIVMQTSSIKLQQRAIQENPTYDELVNLGISQEQAKKKASKLPDGESETVSKLQAEVLQLKQAQGSSNKFKPASSSKKKVCENCCSWRCKGGNSCYAQGKDCNACKKSGHFAASKLCQGKKKKGQVVSRKIQEAMSSSESEESVSRILTVAKMKEEKEDTSIRRRTTY